MSRRHQIHALVATALCAVFVLGCASIDGDTFHKQQHVEESAHHTGGQALTERKVRMRRTQRDLMHLQQTLETLRRHRYDAQFELMAGFVRPYLRDRVDPLISDREESWHPDLVALDANLLFAKGAVLAELGDRRSVESLIRTLEQRYPKMGSLLVEFPKGTQSTLSEGLSELRARL